MPIKCMTIVSTSQKSKLICHANKAATIGSLNLLMPARNSGSFEKSRITVMHIRCVRNNEHFTHHLMCDLPVFRPFFFKQFRIPFSTIIEVTYLGFGCIE